MERRDAVEGSPATVSPTRPQRGLLTAAVLAGAFIVGAVAWSAVGAVEVSGPGTTLRMTDYAFSPSSLTWRVDERVTLTVVNDSGASPPKEHELMFGRDALSEPDPFGRPIPGDGFETPLLDGVAIELEGGGGLVMLMAPGSQLTGVAPQSVVEGAGMEMEMMDQFMAVFTGGGELTMSFVVPDRPGEWEFGCFAQGGQHYLNGMRGSVTILPAEGS